MNKKIKTNDGTKGGWLVGKRHYDEQGNPLGGIKAVVTDAGNRPVELEGGEVIINREASKKYWKELSRINQSAGNGVAIGPPTGADEDPEEYKDGGNVIEFNPNHLPNKWIVSYAKKIKSNHPEIWKLGGNIFGNEAFNNLERVSERGYWLDSEKWMYIKWRSFVARHKKDFRIAGVVAMLKWCDKVEKGWPYMKELIEDKIAKKGWKHKQSSKKMKDGGNVITYKDKYNTKYGYKKGESHSLEEVSKDTGVSMKGLQQIYDKGIGAYKTNPSSVRPNVTSKEQWAMARVYSSVMGGKAAKIDAKELKMVKGGGVGQKITCVKCDWNWNTNQSKEFDKYVCHNCGTDNSMVYAPKKQKDGGLLAPNKKPSNLTPLQYKLVRTPAFKEWFGDWENDPANASKIVDENGEPLVVYHGTIFDFTIFKVEKPTIGAYGQGFYFTNNKEFASNYARGNNAKILNCFLNIRNILTIEDDELPNGYQKYSNMSENKGISRDFTKKIISENFNGVLAKNNYNENEYVVFEPNQIKLADGTNTTFDGNNPDIRFEGGGNVKWSQAKIGDSARVVAENKMGVIVKDYGRKFHLKFVDGTEKTYDASELHFYNFDEDKYDDGGNINTYVVNTEGVWGGRGKPRIKVVSISLKTVKYLDYSDNKIKSDTKEKFDRLFTPDSSATTSTTVQAKPDIYELKKSIFAPDLYNTKIIVNTEEKSKAFQMLAIELGITWPGGNKIISNTEAPYLFIDDEFGEGKQILGYGNDTPPDKDYYTDRASKELFFDDLFQFKSTGTITSTKSINKRSVMPSTDSSTWSNEFNEGDIVYIRKDIADFVVLDFDSLDNAFVITNKLIVPGANRTQNPSGSLYKIKQINGDRLFDLEGKDILLLISDEESQTTTKSNKPVHELSNYRIKTEKEFINEYGSNWREDNFTWEPLMEWKPLMDWMFGKPITDLVEEDDYNYVLAIIKQGITSFTTKDETGTNEGNWNITSNFVEYDISTGIDFSTLFPDEQKTNVKVKDISEVKTERELIHDEYQDIIFLIENTLGTDTENMLSLKTQAKELKDKLDVLDLELKKKNTGELNLLDELFSASSVQPQARYDLKPYSDGFAPDGQPTALPKNIYDWTISEEFQNWFGNFTLAYNYKNSSYENIPCSIVVNKNYEPLVVYHGTGAEFSFFKFDRFPAMYFAENEAYSNWFAEMKGQETGTQGYVYPFILNIRTPLDLTYFEINDVSPDEFIDWMYLQTGLDADELKINKALTDPSKKFKAWRYLRSSPEMLEVLRDKNVCDGIVYYEDNPSVDVKSDAYKTKAYIVFNSNSAKIAEPSRHKLAIAAMRSFYLKRGGKL